MNSTLSSQNADNISRKSGFSNRLSFEGPGIQGELPHHGQTLSWGGSLEVVVDVVFIELLNT
jgi:hypothetical protein